jgi:hypothetical protein
MSGRKSHKTESDVEPGRTNPDDALDVGETGAEPRSERA